jgi:hypothetical protein
VESGRIRFDGSPVPWLHDADLMRDFAGVYLKHLTKHGENAFVGAHNFEIPYAAVHYLLGDTLYSSPAHYQPGDVLDLGLGLSEQTGDRFLLRAQVLRKAKRSEVPPDLAHFLAYPGLYWIRLD